MLSTANPPPDPSSDEISKLKSGYSINSDEKDINNLEVDLLQSGLDDISQTLPKFSIRGYVYKTRDKDIKTNWPFSRKSLKLCLNNGIKDVLPPFETIESVRNPFSANLSGPSDHILPVSSKNASQTKVDLDSDKLKSNSHEKDKQYYPSDVNPVPFRIKSPSTKPEITARAANKVKTNISTQNPAKKCRLIVKVGNNNISEELSDAAMASKVCPVCKTFTSSSNTTLNAHIDQCLSGESTSVKWTENPKVIKHRIKPRKTRLMVDIYETALPCTLEDLDRRNGTNWASNFGFQAQENDKNTNDTNVNHSVSNGEDKKEESAVYIDSNGTKLRILSKLGDLKFNSNGEEDDCGPRKLVKRDKESKIVPSKKMKLLKRQPYEQRRSPRPGSCPKINDAQKIKFSNQETVKDDVAQPLKARDRQTKHINNVPGTIKPWVSSKRTYHKNPNRITRNSRTKTQSSPLDDIPLSATESDHTTNESESNTSSSSDDEYIPEQQRQKPCLTNKACSYFSDDHDNNKNDYKRLSNSNFNRPRENVSIVNVDRPFISSRGKKLPTLTKNNLLSIRRELFSESKKCLGRRKCLSGFKKSAIRLWNNYPVEKQDEIDETRVEKESRVLKIRKKTWDTASPSESNRHGSQQNNINSFTGHVMRAGPFSSAKVVENISDEMVHEEEPLVAFSDDFAAEVNVSDVEGHYFVDVDPIPIPGPPGSFLPSPGRMGSEELQGNSSLTSCRLHSSEDERELIIDRIDSSDSTVSGVSNSMSARSDPLLTFRASGPNVNLKTNEVTVKPVFPEPPSPSTPNPVLRLMGKDLLVVNKEENPSTQFGPGFVSTANGFPNRSSCADDFIKFSRDPRLFYDDRFPNRMPFDFSFNFTTSPQFPAPHHQSPNYCHGYADRPAFAPVSSNCGGKRKEIIMIDDSPKKEPTLGYKQHVNPFFDYQTRCYPYAPVPNGNSVIWNRDPLEGPSLQRRDSLNAPSQLTGHHERSSFYFSNGFPLPSNFS
ncbi:hypothetical protein CASFOL_018744 [Castilleja foliolosa]|uniref:Uncharacterized protein n=1 Tax=Castilleja foliolosa TaxID=1961234 RepID=A0ABD3D7M7_9LAMI